MRGRYLAVCARCGRTLERARPMGTLAHATCLCASCSGIDARTAREREVVERFLDSKGDE